MALPSSGMLTLYMSGPNPESGNLSLWSFGVLGYVSSGVNLFIHGKDSGTGPFNLFLQGDQLTPHSSGLPLYLQASSAGTSGIYNYMPLYIEGDVFTSSMNLFMSGYSYPISYESSLNLFLGNTAPYHQGNIDLYTVGGATGGTLGNTNKSLNLSITGEGFAAGYYPYSGWMNLYLHSPGANNNLNLYLKSEDLVTNNVNLYTKGVLGYTSGTLPLYMARYGVYSSGLNLFIRGWNDLPPGPPAPPQSGFLQSLDLDELFMLSLDELFNIGL